MDMRGDRLCSSHSIDVCVWCMLAVTVFESLDKCVWRSSHSIDVCVCGTCLQSLCSSDSIDVCGDRLCSSHSIDVCVWCMFAVTVFESLD